MFANTLILLFIVAMACWWGLAQGLFSAFLQLMMTVIAAALAIALWEPIAMDILIWYIPKYAWGVGLLAPFILWLIMLRTAAGMLVPTGIELGPGINVIGGAACGLLSAVLVSGLTVLGVSFLPLPPDAGGYRPLVIQEKWQVMHNQDGRLWLPVDQYTRAFLDTLSSGAFFSGWPMATYQPDLVMQAALLRMRFDPDSTVVAMPNRVSVTNVYGWPMPVEGLDKAFDQQIGDRSLPLGNQLLVVDTKWQMTRDTLDKDGVLRVPPTQIRLATWHAHQSPPSTSLYAPVGWAQVDPTSQKRVYTPFDSSAKPVLERGESRNQLLAWVFVIPVEEQAGFILARRLRLRLTGMNADPISLISAIGRPTGDGLTTTDTAN